MFEDEGYNNMGGGTQIGGWAALAAAGLGVYDSWRNRVNAKENTDKTIAAQKSESELAYQRSVEMWNQQNMYNSPQAQMQRYMEAGLNPHLIYGQGTPGNAVSPPQYQPANLQYRYEAPQYGAAIQSILPTLMAVGTWMQNMRASEVDIQKGTTETEKARQMIEYLYKANPKLIAQLDEKLSMYPYQKSMLEVGRDIATGKLHELSAEYRHRFGDDLWEKTNLPGGRDRIGGLRRLQFMQESSKQKILDAKASWSDFNITDPQQLIQLVLQGVMGMAGAQLRANKVGQSARPQVSQKARPTGVRRIAPSRRVKSGDSQFYEKVRNRAGWRNANHSND